MNPLSTGGPMSSRMFTARILRTALYALPSTQTRAIRKLAASINKRTGIGYYAALDLVAIIGIQLTKAPSSQISPELSTKPVPRTT